MSDTSSGVSAATRASTSAGVDACRRRPRSPPRRSHRRARRRAAPPCARGAGRSWPSSIADVVVAEEAVDGDEHAGAAAVEEVGRLGALVPGVDRHDHAAGGLQAEHGDDPLPHVGRPDRHAVARLEPGGDERAAGVDDRVAELPEGQPHVAVDQRLGVAEALGGRAHEAGRGAPLEVAADPRLHRLAHVHAASSSSVVVIVARRASVLSITASA